jgi:hypothetical protein
LGAADSYRREQSRDGVSQQIVTLLESHHIQRMWFIVNTKPPPWMHKVRAA